MEAEQRPTAIIYARVSSKEQVDGTSLSMQVKLCYEYAERKGYKVLIDPFIEEGESAKSAERTQFQKALAYCSDKKQQVDYFIVYKIDRFARNQADHAMVKMMLEKSDTKLRSVTEPIDDSPVGKAMEGILSVFAEFDNNVRAQRSKSGMEERVKSGVWVWAAPIGYKRITKGGNLVIDEDKAPYIVEAFKEWRKGTYTYRSLADHLYESGFRSKSGNKVYPQSIEKIIRNPIYCGIILAFKEKIEVKGAFEPIIAEEIFYDCQPSRIKKIPNTKRRALNPNFPLKSLLNCPECNRSLTGSSSTGRGGKKHPYYHHHRQNCSLAKSHKKDVVEQQFVEYLKRISPKHKKYEKAFKEIVMDVWQSNYKKLDEDNERIRKEVKSLEQDRQKIFDAHRVGVYTDSEFLDQKDRISQLIRQKKHQLREKEIEEFDMEEALSFCFELVRDSCSTWKNLEYSSEFRLRFQKLIFPEKIMYDGEKFGTDKLALVYELKESYDADSSDLVTH